MYRGYLCLVLHAHLPFVRHPEHLHFLEERWLYEAITETYIPLIQVFERLFSDNIPFRLTISLSPTLISMLTDSLLQERYLKHLERLIELSDREAGRTYNSPFHNVALMYQKQFRHTRQTYLNYNRNLVQVFKKFFELGNLEIITSTATHSVLPLIYINKNAVRAQIKTAVDLYARHFGDLPRGIWLPECAYTPGIDELLKEVGLKYFILDTHGLLFASPRPKYGVFAPILCPTGVAAFGRDVESSSQVWSSKDGYPGDSNYREFYRDIGFDLEYEYIKPYIHPDGIRIDTGIKYHRITGKTDYKEPYVPWLAKKQAISHANDFLLKRLNQVQCLHNLMDRPPIIVAPYDAELFGHWWFAGPIWLESLIRKIHSGQMTLTMTTPCDYLSKYNHNQTAIPAASSWGKKGYNEMWLNKKNAWIYRHLHAAADKMVVLAENFCSSHGLTARAINQAARELMLSQSSDWAFIINTDTMTQYAIQRTKTHLNNFNTLYSQVTENKIDAQWLSQLEVRNNLFPNMDFHHYSSSC